MKVKLSDKSRSILLKAWKSGVLDIDEVEELRKLIPAQKPMTIEEAKRIIAEL